ncbi:MAG TPA: PAS domain S-box protein, partial [Candidatus Nanoarchaeia archaeon]|nr:PAS domain S-box protein [Candidatus Nanoarchaeia archaeon]
MVKKESSEISKNTSLKPEALLNIMQDLEKEKKKFENLFENSADAIFITDIGEKKITDCNKKALDITGYNKEEIIGMHPKYLHPKEIREESMKVFEKYNKSESMRYETRLLTKQGKKIPISISTSIIELESEKIAVGLFRDISDRKKAEEQLKHKEELERIISEISNNLINTGEEGIDKQLENVLEKIGRFSEAGRSYIFQFSDDMKNMNNTHEWTAEDVEPQKDNLQKLSTPKFPWMMKKIKNFETIRVSKLSELPSETETFRKHLKKQNIKSLLVVPLVSNNNLKGLIGFDWIEKEGEWSGEIINLLRIVGEIIAGVLDRKEKREKIEEERKRIKRYLETAEVMILGLDIEGNVIEANRKATEILGYDKEEIIGKNWLDNFIPKRFRKEIRNIHKEAIKKKSFAKNYENPVLTKSGKERIINWKNRFFTNSEGKVTGTLSSGMDVTKKRKQEEKLKESEKRLSQIFKGISVPTFVIDKEHNVIRWNKACEKLTGISREEIEGTKKQWKSFYNKKRPVLADLIVDEASEEKFNKYYQDKWKKFPLIKGAYKAEDFFQNIGGKERWIFFTASPIKNSKGEITGAIETLQDITQRKEREDSLQRLVDITSETTGEEFFDSLVKKLVDWFDADGAFVGRLSEDEKMVSSISMFLNEKKVENYEYPLSGSPCEKITEKGISLYRENVTKKFPKDKDLKKLGVEGYLGAPIRKENGKTKGILWVISKNKFEKLPVKWKDLLKIITSRAAAEIERKDKEELLKFEKERFQQIFDNVNDALYLHEIGEKGEPGKFVEVNQVACDMLGYSK